MFLSVRETRIENRGLVPSVNSLSLAGIYPRVAPLSLRARQIRPATLFHSRNWLRTRRPIKRRKPRATARTRIKIAAFLEAR